MFCSNSISVSRNLQFHYFCMQSWSFINWKKKKTICKFLSSEGNSKIKFPHWSGWKICGLLLLKLTGVSKHNNVYWRIFGWRFDFLSDVNVYRKQPTCFVCILLSRRICDFLGRIRRSHIVNCIFHLFYINSMKMNSV